MTAKVSGASKMKIPTGGFKKAIALVVTAAFVLQMHIPLHPQVEAEIVKQFQRAKARYVNGQYDDARMRIERVIDIINEKNIYRKDILGMCYLLLGAIDEKQNKPLPAEENYLKARGVYGITLVDGVDLEGLALYREKVKGESSPPSRDGKIEKEGAKKKKKFPWLLTVGAVVVVGALVYFLLLKPRKKFTLTVVRGTGVQGDPQGNTYRYKKGTIVAYNYTPAPGYSGLAVTLDGNIAPNFGVVNMDKDHILVASSSLNEVTLAPDRSEVEIPEGKSIAFSVKLSAQPRANVNVTVSRASGDQDIQVLTDQLNFTTANWNTPKSVSLKAAEDADVVDGEALIRLSADGIPNIYITVREKDNDHPTVSIIEPVDRDTVKGEVTVTAEAAAAAAEKIITRVEFYIDGKKEGFDIAAPYSYTWDTAGVPDGQHRIKAIAYDLGGFKGEHEISVTVKNRYTLKVTKGNGVDGAPDTGENTYADGEIVTYNYLLLPGYNNLRVLLDGVAAAASGSITMDRDHELKALANPALYSLAVEMGEGALGSPGETGEYTEGETVLYSYWPKQGYFDLEVRLDGNLVENSGAITMAGNHTLEVEAKVGFEIDTDQVVICEGKTKSFGVKLSAQPGNPVNAGVRWESGDADISVEPGANLNFTDSNWNVFQYVSLHAAADTDTQDGWANIDIEAPGLFSKTIVAEEHDTNADAPPGISLSGISDGQVVYGIVVIVAEVKDDDGVINRVEFYIDGELKETKETGTGANYKYEWNTAGVALGEHKIKIIAYDMCDQPGEKEITVSVVLPPSHTGEN